VAGALCAAKLSIVVAMARFSPIFAPSAVRGVIVSRHAPPEGGYPDCSEGALAPYQREGIWAQPSEPH
jgi:hypothetical protein